MQRNDLKQYDLPDEPGVYRFIEKTDKGEEILYVGKATSLKDRIRSYFNPDLIVSRGPRIVDMVTRSNHLHWEATDSVLEALILESLEIKRHQPFYNVREKDDKSYLWVIITNEEWPRVLLVRGKELGVTFDLSQAKYQYGPFPSGPTLRRALEIIRKIFPFYDTKHPVRTTSKHQKTHIEFNRQIGRYPRNMRQEEYLRNIRHIHLFLGGRKKQVIRELEQAMKRLAKEERFEEAERVRQQLFALTHIQDVSLIRNDLRRTHGMRIEAYDVAHTSGQETVGVMTVVEDGELVKEEYKKFIIRTHTNNDVGALGEMLERRFVHPEWKYPRLIVVDGGKAQKNKAEKMLAQFGLEIPVVAVTKDERHRPRTILGKKNTIAEEVDIVLANAEAHRFALSWHQKRRGKI